MSFDHGLPCDTMATRPFVEQLLILRKEDLRRGEVFDPKHPTSLCFKIDIRSMHMANLVIYIGDGGETHVIKNRWGATGKVVSSKPSVMDPAG